MSSRLSSFPLAAALLASGLRAQPAPSAPAGGPPPSAAAPAHATILLDQFVTTAAPFSRHQVDLAQSTTVLGGASLFLRQQSTLGETLSAETGISATSFGPGASRPIIRGLGGDRIRLLENSVGMLDASVTSPDHAVSVEPLLIDRVEIVRGPASLLYGSSAVGGVVNVITHRIETEMPAEDSRGSAELRYGSAADEIAGGAVTDIALRRRADHAVVLHLDGFRRTTDDLRIPGFAASAQLRAEDLARAREQGERVPSFASGRLPNSALDSKSAAAGLSFVSERLQLGVSYSGLNRDYGVPEHALASGAENEGVRIDLRQRRTDVQGEWHDDARWLKRIRLKFGHANYRHVEVEPGGEIGTRFTNRGYDGRLEFLHGDGKPWSGAIGLQSSFSDFAAEGEEAFLPPSRSRHDAVFAFEEAATGAVTWQFGGRVERSRIATEDARTRNDTPFSGSLGAVWKLSAANSIAVSLTHTSRAPNAQELFARGPHVGTQAFEIGDASLDNERSLGAEASFRRRSGFVTGALTIYANRFAGYIFEEPTGEVEEDLPVYRYVQRDAQFWGAELETIWHLHAAHGSQFDLKLAADLTRAREDSRNLPRIPAARFTTGIVWAHQGWSATAESQWVLDQNRVATGETPTPGYTLVSGSVSRTFTTARQRWEIFLRGTNLANVEARPHTSFVKDLAPLPARAITSGIRWSF